MSASTDQPNQAVPQVQINNNQYNPEIITNRFMTYLFCFLVPFGIFLILEYHNMIDLNEILPKMTNLGLTQAIFQLFFSIHAYSTNEQLRKFVFDMYASCFH